MFLNPGDNPCLPPVETTPPLTERIDAGIDAAFADRRVGCLARRWNGRRHVCPSAARRLMRSEVGIELCDLRYFLVAADHGSFRKAGAALGIQESSICQRIRDLEDQLGASLFHRYRGGVSLTVAGEQFRTRAWTILGRHCRCFLDRVWQGWPYLYRTGRFHCEGLPSRSVASVQPVSRQGSYRTGRWRGGGAHRGFAEFGSRHRISRRTEHLAGVRCGHALVGACVGPDAEADTIPRCARISRIAS